MALHARDEKLGAAAGGRAPSDDAFSLGAALSTGAGTGTGTGTGAGSGNSNSGSGLSGSGSGGSGGGGSSGIGGVTGGGANGDDIMEVDVLCAMLEARKPADRLKLADDTSIRVSLKQFMAADQQRANNAHALLLKQQNPAAAATVGAGTGAGLFGAKAAEPWSPLTAGSTGSGSGSGSASSLTGASAQRSPPQSPQVVGASGTAPALPFAIRLPAPVLLEDERVVFSDVVTKLNRKQKAQSRVLMITNRAVYNISVSNYKNIKRRILILTLSSLTLSDTGDDFVFHVTDDYDYHFRSVRRADICHVVSYIYRASHPQRATLPCNVSRLDGLTSSILTKTQLHVQLLSLADPRAAASFRGGLSAFDLGASSANLTPATGANGAASSGAAANGSSSGGSGNGNLFMPSRNVLTAKIRELVSGNKRRYRADGFDLDLTYISTRVIAMGFPSQDLEGLYRNPYPEVFRFLETKHKDHYRVYNLCSERRYDAALFHNRVVQYGFRDHQPAPLRMILAFCQDATAYLRAHPHNVIAVHCKAGKGRTGLMICALMVFSGMAASAADAIASYGVTRTHDGKGVTITSQQRFVGYFERFLKEYFGPERPFNFSGTPLVLHTIRMSLCPGFGWVPPHAAAAADASSPATGAAQTATSGSPASASTAAASSSAAQPAAAATGSSGSGSGAVIAGPGDAQPYFLLYAMTHRSAPAATGQAAASASSAGIASDAASAPAAACAVPALPQHRAAKKSGTLLYDTRTSGAPVVYTNRHLTLSGLHGRVAGEVRVVCCARGDDETVCFDFWLHTSFLDVRAGALPFVSSASVSASASASASASSASASPSGSSGSAVASGSSPSPSHVYCVVDGRAGLDKHAVKDKRIGEHFKIELFFREHTAPYAPGDPAAPAPDYSEALPDDAAAAHSAVTDVDAKAGDVWKRLNDLRSHNQSQSQEIARLNARIEELSKSLDASKRPAAAPLPAVGEAPTPAPAADPK